MTELISALWSIYKYQNNQAKSKKITYSIIYLIIRLAESLAYGLLWVLQSELSTKHQPRFLVSELQYSKISIFVGSTSYFSSFSELLWIYILSGHEDRQGHMLATWISMYITLYQQIVHKLFILYDP